MPKKNSSSTSSVKRLNTVTPVSKVLAAVLFIILPFIGFYLGMEYQRSVDEALMQGESYNVIVDTPPEAGVSACTMDVKVCPDGSAVGRSGPDCEFEKCPGE